MKKNNAISKLRFKLIAVSMAVTLLVLGLIIGGINFKKIIDNADRAINYLAESYNQSGNMSPEPPERWGEGEFAPFDEGISPEIKFESRYFLVSFDIEETNLTENITGENADQLFERFYRADTSRNSETGGHGIGLSMAKAIVEAHGGKIEAKLSEDNKLKIKIGL